MYDGSSFLSVGVCCHTLPHRVVAPRSMPVRRFFVVPTFMADLRIEPPRPTGDCGIHFNGLFVVAVAASAAAGEAFWNTL